MKTIYINDGNDGIPERFDYEWTEGFSGEYGIKTGEPVKYEYMEAYHVQGYNYQTREYVGRFNSEQELIDTVRAIKIV